jgi:hypothetical protein
MTAAICVDAGIAVEPNQGGFSFWVSAGGAAVYSTYPFDLKRWNFDDMTCTKIVLMDDDCLGVIFHNKRNGKKAAVEYRASPEKRRQTGETVCLLQARMRAALVQSKLELERKEVLAVSMFLRQIQLV